MAQQLRLPDFVVDQLRCSICKGYLSSPPLHVLPTGESICGLCSSSTPTEPTYRQLTMESFLKHVSFLCEFRKYGCEAHLQFGQAKDHEKNCIYRVITCPSSSCKWEGSAMKLLEHFTQDHPTSVKTELEFKLLVKSDEEDLFMVVRSCGVFIIRYQYQRGRLCYDVQYFTLKQQDVSYRLRLSNEADFDYTCTLKRAKCTLFNSSFYYVDSAPGLVVLGDYLKILNKPDCISVFLEVVVAQSSDCLVDYALLESLKCRGCQEYLKTPIFESDQGPLCYNCILCDFTQYRPSNDKQLIEAIASARYPCCWEGCSFTGNGIEVKKHEGRCMFYHHTCSASPGTDTKSTAVFKAEEVIAHLQNHGCQFFGSDEVTYKMSFAELYDWQSFFTLKHGRVVLVQHRMVAKNTHEVLVRVNMFSPAVKNRLQGPPLRCEVQFEQPKYKVKSQVFAVSETRTFTMESLPNCYKSDDQLTVKLKLFM